MTFMERVEQFTGAFWGALGASVGGGVFVLIRKILTDSARITALETRLDTQDEHRKERDKMQLEIMSDLKDGMAEMRTDVKQLFRGDSK